MKYRQNILVLSSRAPPFWVIFYFQLAWVFDFCLRMKYWEMQNFFEIEPRLDPASSAFLNRTP